MALEWRLVIETVERAAVLGLLGGGRHVPAALPSVLVRHHWRLDHGVWLMKEGVENAHTYVGCVRLPLQPDLEGIPKTTSISIEF